MIHKIFGWIGGYVRVQMRGENIERFVNLCRNHGILLWQICWNPKEKTVLFFVSLEDFYRLRPIVRKCKVRPLVVKRYGLPFFVKRIKKQGSFFVGVSLFFCLLLFFSTRIWGIDIQGASYHTRESILQYLDSIGIYGGMDGGRLECSRLKEQIRKHYNDIGWVSVEKRGSRVYIQIRETLPAEKEKEEKKGHLIASEDGRIVSIVTRKGTARVRAGKRVKRGEILIAGHIKIYGDNQELIEKNYVHAEGTVVLETTEKYADSLEKKYQKKEYTKRSKKVYECQIGNQSVFYYNPLKNLETYKKYDIIREGGQLCPFLSLRFPVSRYVKTFREIQYRDAEYTKEEAEKILEDRLAFYLKQKRAEGYRVKKAETQESSKGDDYEICGNIVFWKEENRYRFIDKKDVVYDSDKNRE